MKEALVKKLFCVVPFAILAGCSPKIVVVTGGPAPVASADSIVLERTRCFGICPTYTLSLTAAGQASFTSHNPGDLGAEIRDSISVARFVRLSADFDALPFSSLPDYLARDREFCGGVTTDMPGAIVTIFKPDGVKRVDDYHGCSPVVGENGAKLLRLRELEDQIDSVANAARWIRPFSRG